MESTPTRVKEYYDRALSHLQPYTASGRELAAARFNKQPHLSSAVIAFALGLLAILIGFPTRPGSTTFAGALFGAGAAFIGAWVAEKNRSTAERVAEVRRIEAARVYFTPELARIVGQQIWVQGRLVPNFSMAAQFKDLSESDATALIDFYDSVHGIAETIEAWIETKTPQEVNAWNVLMQAVRDSLRLGEIAVRRFCPDRQLSPLLPASGTLMQNIERSDSMVQTALTAHLARHETKAAARKP